jgi:N-methylhydantoinase A
MYRIGVDIGGTFTDCVVVDDEGRRSIAKSLTTHESLPDGVMRAVELNAAEHGVSLQQLLEQTTEFVHGTTVATNAVLTRNGAKTGLITTRGHEDAIIIGKVFAKRAGLAERDLVHASRLNKPQPLVPPELIKGVSERIDVEGEIIAPLNEQEVVDAIGQLVAEGVEAIAVSLLWSFVNDVHEKRIAELLAEHAPDVFSTISCELAPVIGEYERTATTVLNAFVGPKVSGYLRGLEARLRDAGLRRPLLVMQASDGLTSVGDAERRPIITLDSGPTGGILGCKYLSTLYDEPNLICADVGGTSFDVGVIAGGVVPLEPEPVVAQYSFRVPKVAVHSIGAGGGSIAWLDDGGVLRVGPQSAGSRPGPACYGLGGTQPTVTDADLVLGYLDADHFLGGRMKLDKDAAYAALGRLGDQAGMEPEEVAIGVARIINSHMADLIRRSTIEQGRDPRDCVLVAYGGAGPTHAAFYGSDIAAKSIIVPADSTVFSAEGMLTCQMVHSAQSSHQVASPFSDEDFAGVTQQLDRLEAGIVEQFGREGVPLDQVVLKRSISVRYSQQIHTVDVEVSAGPLGLGDAVQIRARFEERYAQLFGAGSLFADGGLEFEMCRVVGTRAVDAVQFAEHESGDADAASAVRTERRIHFESTGFTTAPVYSGDALASGHRIDGPAVIERMGDSVVVPPGCVAAVDPYLTLVITSTAGAPAPAGHTTRLEVVQ